MARLKSARMTNDTLVSQIDDLLGELESDVAQILGYTLDTNITESAFLIDNSGRVTKPLVRMATAVPAVGEGGIVPSSEGMLYSITNTTNSNNALVGLTNLEIGVEGHGSPENLFLTFGGPGTPINEGDGFFALNADETVGGYFTVWGTYFTASSQGLLPAGSGNADEYLCSDGTFKDPGVTFDHELTIVTHPADNSGGGQDVFSYDALEVPRWEIEVYDPFTNHAAIGSTIIIDTTGKYLIGAQMRVIDFEGNDGLLDMWLVRTHSAVDSFIATNNMRFPGTPSNNEVTLSLDTVYSLTAGDTVRLEISYTVVHVGNYAASPFDNDHNFYALRVA